MKLPRYRNRGHLNEQAAALCLICPVLSEITHTRTHEGNVQAQLLGIVTKFVLAYRTVATY